MTDPDYFKFLNSGDLNSRGGAISFDNSETFYAAVEKYLSDNAVLSTTGAACPSYITENKGATGQVFKLGFQNI